MEIKLIRIDDMREYDWFTEKRIPLAPGEGHICDRCGKEHAIIWRIMVIDGPKGYQEMSVGSTCGKRILFDGKLELEAKYQMKEIREAQKNAWSDAITGWRDAIAWKLRAPVDMVPEMIHEWAHPKKGYIQYGMEWEMGGFSTKQKRFDPMSISEELPGVWRHLAAQMLTAKAKEIAEEMGLVLEHRDIRWNVVDAAAELVVREAYWEKYGSK